jgi:hypothetical protein
VKFSYSVITLLVALLLTSVSRAEVSSIHISSRLDPNAIIITQVDIVFVYSQELLEQFPETKTDWYSKQRQFIAAAGANLDVVSVFIPQGFDSETASLPARRNDALKVFVFAQHDDSKAAPVDISELSNVLVEIDAFGILVSRRD